MSSCALAVSASASSGKVVDSALASSDVTLCNTAASGRGAVAADRAGLTRGGAELGQPGQTAHLRQRGDGHGHRLDAGHARLGGRGGRAGPRHRPRRARRRRATASAPRASSCWRQRTGTVGSAWRATSATIARTTGGPPPARWARGDGPVQVGRLPAPLPRLGHGGDERARPARDRPGRRARRRPGDGSRARASTSRGDGAAPYRADAAAASTRASTDPCAEPDARPAPGAPGRPAPFVRPVRPVRRLSPRDVRVRCRIA